MKILSRFATAFLLALVLLPSVSAQNRREVNVMEYYVNGKDTIYLDEIPPAVIHRKRR